MALKIIRIRIENETRKNLRSGGLRQKSVSRSEAISLPIFRDSRISATERINFFSCVQDLFDEALSLNYERFSLQWNSEETTKELQLDGTNHLEIVKWISERSSEANIAATYNYKFHYELPYKINDDFTFRLLDEERLEKLMHFRILAQLVLENFVANNNLKSDVRIWPHHFDTGAYISFENGSNKAIGLGLAIPDSVSADHYFYASGYKDQNSIDTSGFSELTNGKWHATQFEGAILPATDIDEA